MAFAPYRPCSKRPAAVRGAAARGRETSPPLDEAWVGAQGEGSYPSFLCHGLGFAPEPPFWGAPPVAHWRLASAPLPAPTDPRGLVAASASARGGGVGKWDKGSGGGLLHRPPATPFTPSNGFGWTPIVWVDRLPAPAGEGAPPVGCKAYGAAPPFPPGRQPAAPLTEGGQGWAGAGEARATGCRRAGRERARSAPAGRSPAGGLLGAGGPPLSLG